MGVNVEDLHSLADLLDLQSLDSDIDRLLDRRASLPELAAYRAADTELSAINAKLLIVVERLREIEMATNKSEGELKLEEAKAHSEEQRLYAGGLSARDAEHMRDEVAMLRRRVSEREDEILALLDEKEQLDSSRSDIEAERDAVTAEKERIEEVVTASWKVIDGDVARLEARKADVIPLIAPELIELYEEIRPTKEGVAVARLAEGICGGCHLTLSAAEQVNAARKFPPRCIHCWRILVLQ